MTNILITNSENKNTLSVLRNIDKNYNKTILSSSRIPTLGSLSKYCNKTIYIPFSNDKETYSKLLALLKTKKYDVLIPVGLSYCTLVNNHIEDIKKYVKVLSPSKESFKIASEKNRTMQFAFENGVPIPKTFRISKEDDLLLINDYPCVVKSSTGSGEFVYYCHSHTELLDRYNHLTESEKKSVICQEYIDGFGCGYFGLYDNGKPLAEYMHKRIKEYPVSGGPSVVAETYYNEKLQEYGRILCNKLKWTGPIMCEFKYSSIDDDFRLIEINPKLWGSLDLTISAGVNIPELMIRYLLQGEKAKGLHPITKFVRYRWVIPGEFQHFLATYPNTKIKEFLSVNNSDKTNLVINDPFPLIYQIILMIYKIIIRSKK